MVLTRGKQSNTCQKMQWIQEKDRISSLPDDLLRQVLSFLPTNNAVATSILSSRWKNLFRLSSGLELDGSLSLEHDMRLSTSIKQASFVRFVARILVQCQTSPITKFRLHCVESVRYSIVNGWIKYAFLLFKVTELELYIGWNMNPYVLHLPELAFQNLVSLKLDSNFILQVPDDVEFPCLKVLLLNGVIFPAGSTAFHSNDEYCFNGLNRFLLGCPLLEELVLIRCNWKGADLLFSNPLLRKFTFYVRDGDREQLNNGSICFNLPSLVYLHYDECLAYEYVIKNLSSVVVAHVEVCFSDDVFQDPKDLSHTMLQLIAGVCNCKFLYLSRQCQQALSGEFELPIFRNLTHMKLDQGVEVSWNDVLPHYLKNSPCLEALTLVQEVYGLNEDLFRRLHPVPSCVTSRLKIIKIENFTGLKWEIDMVRYFLENAKALEQLVIHLEKPKLDKSREKYILKLPKASKSCLISFK